MTEAISMVEFFLAVLYIPLSKDKQQKPINDYGKCIFKQTDKDNEENDQNWEGILV